MYRIRKEYKSTDDFPEVSRAENIVHSLAFALILGLILYGFAYL